MVERLGEKRIQKIKFPALLSKRTPNLVLLILHFYNCAFLHSLATQCILHAPFKIYHCLRSCWLSTFFWDIWQRTLQFLFFSTNMQGITHCLWHFLEFLFRFITQAIVIGCVCKYGCLYILYNKFWLQYFAHSCPPNIYCYIGECNQILFDIKAI